LVRAEPGGKITTQRVELDFQWPHLLGAASEQVEFDGFEFGHINRAQLGRGLSWSLARGGLLDPLESALERVEQCLGINRDSGRREIAGEYRRSSFRVNARSIGNSSGIERACDFHQIPEQLVAQLSEGRGGLTLLGHIADC
jgi:hypothetical protein